jgi:hypothetical protein
MKHTQVLQATFDARQTHSRPAVFPDIPEGWTIPLVPTVSHLPTCKRQSSIVNIRFRLSLQSIPEFKHPSTFLQPPCNYVRIALNY